MKIIGLLFLLFTSHYVFAQKTEAFYDYFWKPSTPENARYFSIIEKTDSGWLHSDYYVSTKQLQMRALFADEAGKIRNGNSLYFFANGRPSVVGRMVNNKQEGVCVRYHSNGMLSDSALFRNGQVVDTRFRWHRNGYIADSIRKVNDSMYVQVGWFDDGGPAYAGFLLNGQNHNKWKYFHHNGQLSATVLYAKGYQVSAEYFDEEGKPLTDTTGVNREATMKGGEAAWKKYLEKKLYWPTGLQFTTPATVTVGISFVIDENGKVTDAEVSMPFHEAFDKIALKVIQNSADWQPAVVNNRKVKAYRVQPVNFAQPD